MFGEESKEENLSDTTVIRKDNWENIKYTAMRPDNDSSLWFVSSIEKSYKFCAEIMD